MSVRQSIADALDTVTGLSGHTIQPPAPTAGQGWPEWVGTRYTNVANCGATPDLVEWQVILMLPALDVTHGDTVRDWAAAALSTVGAVTEARPDTVPLTADADAPVIRYTLTTPGG